MSPRHRPVSVAASGTSLTLLAFLLAGISSSPGALWLAVIGLAPAIVMPLWLGRPAFAPAGAGCRS